MCWMKVYQYKPMCTVTLERVHNQVWHERTVARELHIIRHERGELLWQTVKDIAVGKRKREDWCVHSRPGPHVHFDSLFCEVWGIHWRTKLDACRNGKGWRQGCKVFVCAAYEVLSLGSDPYQGHEHPIPQPGDADEEKEINQLQLPRWMERYEL